MYIYRCRRVGRYRRSHPGTVSVDTRTELFEEHQGEDGLRAKTDPVIEIKTQTGSVLNVCSLISDYLAHQAAVQPRKKNLRPSCLTAVVMMVGILAPPLAAITLDLTTSAGAQMADSAILSTDQRKTASVNRISFARTGSDGPGQETSSKLQDRTIPRPLDAQQHLLEHIIRSQLGSVHQDRSHLQQNNSLVSVSYQTTMNPAGAGIATHSVGLPSAVKSQDTFILDDPV